MNAYKWLTGEFPGGLVVRIWHFHRYGPGSIPGLGTEIAYHVPDNHGKKKNDKLNFYLFTVTYHTNSQDNTQMSDSLDVGFKLQEYAVFTFEWQLKESTIVLPTFCVLDSF